MAVSISLKTAAVLGLMRFGCVYSAGNSTSQGMDEEEDGHTTRRMTTVSCPSTHPYAYHTNNAYCCKTNKEKVHTPQGEACDGSALHAGSLCCEGDQYIPCQGASCKNFDQADCFESNRKYHPTNMLGQGRTVVNSPAECQRRCDSVNGCAHFSFWRDGGCHLQDSAVYAQVAGGVTAGPPNCQGENWVKVASSGWCYRPNQVDANGNLILNNKGAVVDYMSAGSLTDCKNFCLSKEWCKYVTYETGQVGWCIAFSACDPEHMKDPPKTWEDRYDTWSRAEPYQLFKSGAECKSGDTWMGKYASVQACAKAVQEMVPSTQMFVFGTGSKAGKCYMENTADCSEGWEEDEYDFYTILLTRHMGP